MSLRLTFRSSELTLSLESFQKEVAENVIQQVVYGSNYHMTLSSFRHMILFPEYLGSFIHELLLPL